jgi:uncharacterized protein
MTKQLDECSQTAKQKRDTDRSKAEPVGNVLFFQTPMVRYVFTPYTGQLFRIQLAGRDAAEVDSQKAIIDASMSRYAMAFRPPCITTIKPGYTLEEVANAIEHDLGHMTLGVTQDCNLRCQYCVYSGRFPYFRHHARVNMTEETALRAADYFLKHLTTRKKHVFVTFYGGEPFLNFPVIIRVREYLARALGSRVHFSITTNGTLLDEQSIEYVVTNRIYLTISLDGDRDTHDRYRLFVNGAPTFDRVVQNLERLRNADEEYFRIYVNFSVTINAGCDYKRMDEFFSNYENGIKVSGVMFYGSDGLAPVRGNTRNLPFLVDKFIEGCLSHAFGDPKRKRKYAFAFAVLGRGLKMIHHRRVSDEILFQDTYCLRKHCIPGASKLFVSPDGAFYPCEKLDSYSHLQIGDLHSGIIAKTVYRYLEQYAALRNLYCKDCYLVDLCDYCFQSASNGAAWDTEKMKLHCQYARDDFKVAFSIYARILEQDGGALDFLEKKENGEK